MNQVSPTEFTRHKVYPSLVVGIFFLIKLIIPFHKLKSSIKALVSIAIFCAALGSFTYADKPKEFLDCGLEAEIAMRVVDSKIKGKPLTEIVRDWQKGEEEYTNDFIETLVTFAYRNYPVMTKLEIANLQLNKCLKAEWLLVERIWLPDA